MSRRSELQAPITEETEFVKLYLNGESEVSNSGPNRRNG
jgi:hypothetical protein